MIVKNGIATARNFSKEKTASETMNCYVEVFNKGSHSL
jgi:hypothetical protein